MVTPPAGCLSGAAHIGQGQGKRIMPRRPLLSPLERASLLEPPEDEYELNQLTAFSEQDFALIQQHRGSANRLGVAVLLCYLRHPGIALDEGCQPAPRLLRRVAAALGAKESDWDRYATRDQTRREHLVKLYAYLGLRPYRAEDGQAALRHLTRLANQTDQALTLAQAMVSWLRERRIVLPSIGVIDRSCAAALTLGSRQVYARLNDALSASQRERLDALLELREGGKLTTLAWLRLNSERARGAAPQLERLRVVEALALPSNLTQLVGPRRMLEWARSGDGMSCHDLAELEPQRRMAMLVAIVLQARAALLRMLQNLEKLKAIDALSLPTGLQNLVSQQRMGKLAAEGRQMKPKDLAKLEPRRRMATLLALVLELRAALVKEILDLRERLVGKSLEAGEFV
ncbi:DUF4158 domain-containing protein [Chromobacterium sp. Rain0013]|nr:DUF4158 domain-containing protein [Chromobacterium sp. Rain0013]